jgi:hypothetical protein
MNTIDEAPSSGKTTIINRLFPQRIDNTYRGYKIALVLFGLVVAVRALQSALIIVNGHSIAQSADGIPLETYPVAAAQTIVAIFAISSLNRLMISLICAVVLVRYRSAVPLMFVVLALIYLASQVILRFVPIVTAGTPPGPILNLVLFALMIIGLALSLFERQSKSTGLS